MTVKGYYVPVSNPTGEQLLLFSGTISGAVGDWEPVTIVGSDGAVLDVTLTSRMLAKQPAAGYALWMDTADPNFLYLLEALSSKTTGQTGFQGVRLPLDASGNIVGKVQSNTGATLTFSNRATDGGWV